MTHDTDCTVLVEYRDDVDQIARMYGDMKHREADEMANDLGWVKIGGGAGRTVWRVTRQRVGFEDATEGEPCVIKFATGGGVHGGKKQNSQEIDAWRSFPEDVRDPPDDVPPIVPIKDWDAKKRWLTMPEVDPGGTPADATRRLGEHGLKCADIGMDNVGMYHGKSVLLDYGLDCEEARDPQAVAEQLRDTMARAGVQKPGAAETHGGSYVTQFYPEESVTAGDERPLDISSVWVNEKGEIPGARFVFGHYDAQTEYDLPHLAEDVAEAVGLSNPGVGVTWSEIDDLEVVPGHVSYVFEIDWAEPGHVSVGDVEDVYRDAANEVRVRFPGDVEGGVAESVADEVADAVDRITGG